MSRSVGFGVFFLFCFVFPTTGVWFTDFFHSDAFSTLPCPLSQLWGKIKLAAGLLSGLYVPGSLLIFLIWGRETQISLHNGMRIEGRTAL